jgi:hypothetical protein
MTRLQGIRIVLVIICLSHVVLGGLAFLGLPGRVAEAVAASYGATLSRAEITGELQHVIRMLGAYMLAVAVLAGYAIADPVRNRFAIDVIVVLFLERVLQRVIFAEEVRSAFEVSAGRLWLQTAFFLAFPVLLLLLRPRATSTAPPDERVSAGMEGMPQRQ